MTRIVPHRCIHCSVVYTFQVSGPPGSTNASPSRDYCTDCWRVVAVALAGVPERCTKRFDEVTDPLLLGRIFAKEEHDREHPTRLFGDGGPIIREVGASLVRLGPDRRAVAHMHPTIVRLDDVKYSIERWSDDSHPVKVIGAVEVNLIDNTTQPWKDYT